MIDALIDGIILTAVWVLALLVIAMFAYAVLRFHAYTRRRRDAESPARPDGMAVEEWSANDNYPAEKR